MQSHGGRQVIPGVSESVSLPLYLLIFAIVHICMPIVYEDCEKLRNSQLALVHIFKTKDSALPLHAHTSHPCALFEDLEQAALSAMNPYLRLAASVKFCINNFT